MPIPNSRSNSNLAARPPPKLRPRAGKRLKSNPRFTSGENVRPRLKSHCNLSTSAKSRNVSVTSTPSSKNNNGNSALRSSKLVPKLPNKPNPVFRIGNFAASGESASNMKSGNSVIPDRPWPSRPIRNPWISSASSGPSRAVFSIRSKNGSIRSIRRSSTNSRPSFRLSPMTGSSIPKISPDITSCSVSSRRSIASISRSTDERRSKFRKTDGSISGRENSEILKEKSPGSSSASKRTSPM